jgi:hypothetical protein
MTEAEWLASTDPWPMLEFLGASGKASDRKLRLFACACCRRIWHLLADKRSRDAVEVAELFADGQASDNDRRAADVQAGAACFSAPPDSSVADAAYAAKECCFPSADSAALHTASIAADDVNAELAQAALLRDIFGTLSFRSVGIDTAWLRWNHGTVPAVARRVYEERAFHDLPILADALEDAGCTAADLLAHCRSGGEHVRGCWAVDLILGKS